MPYIGTSPSNGVRRVYTYTATASQTTFSGASNEGSTLAYVDNNYLDVYQNGILLGSADYTSTNGTSVVLAQAASVNDIIVIIAYDVFSVADTVSKTDGGTFDSAVTMANNLTVSGAFTSQGIDDNADATAITIDSSERATFNSNVSVGSSSFPSKFTVSHAGTDNVIETANTTNSTRGGIQADTSSVGMGAITNHSLLLRVNNSTKFALDTSGNCISAGKTDSSTDDSTILRSDGAVTIRRASSGGASHLFILNGGSQVGSITSNTGQTFFNTTSDYRLKENVNYTFDATSTVKLLKPAKFNYIADESNTLIEGFLAHEVGEVVPQAIHGTKDATDEDGNIIPQQIDHSALVPLLVKTIQELEARITALENA